MPDPKSSDLPPNERYFVQYIESSESVGSIEQLALMQKALNDGVEKGWTIVGYQPPEGDRPAYIRWDTRGY